MRREFVVSCLLSVLLLGGCQTAEVSSWLPGSKPAPLVRLDAPPPPAPAPVPVPVVISPPPPVAIAAPAPIPLASRPMVKDEIRAALLVPLSGPNASLGAVLSNAAQLALFETADEHFNLIPIDTKGTPDGAVAATRMALGQGADIVLGPMFSAEVRAAGPVAREQGIPMLAFTTDRSVLGGGVWSLGVLPGSQARAVVQAAVADHRGRFAVLAPNNDYGKTLVEALKAAVAEAGMRMVRVEYYDPSVIDPTAAAKKFVDYERRRGDLDKEKKVTAGRSSAAAAASALAEHETTLPYDAVFLPDEGVRLKSVASLVTYYGIDPGPVRLLGTLLWNDPKLADEPSLDGGWFPAPPEASHAEFEAHYQTAFGTLPPRLAMFASTAYDATRLAATMAKRGQGDFSIGALTDRQGFNGVDGLVRLNADGTSDRILAIREMTRGGSREVAAAQSAFTPPTIAPLPH